MPNNMNQQHSLWSWLTHRPWQSLIIFILLLGAGLWFFNSAPAYSKLSAGALSLEKGSAASLPASTPDQANRPPAQPASSPTINVVAIETSAPAAQPHPAVIDISDWVLPQKVILKKFSTPIPILDGNINVSYGEVWVKSPPAIGIALGGINSEALKVAIKSAEGERISIYKGPFGTIWTDWLSGAKFDLEYLGHIFEISVIEDKRQQNFSLTVKQLSRSGLQLRTFNELREFPK